MSAEPSSAGYYIIADRVVALSLVCCRQVMFGLGKSIAAQDPSYPVYVDTSVMMGNTGLHNGKGFDNIEYMVCTPENNFFPDLANVRMWLGRTGASDVARLCSYNQESLASSM
jgi:LL-diaminopimelate aminotransferase